MDWSDTRFYDLGNGRVADDFCRGGRKIACSRGGKPARGVQDKRITGTIVTEAERIAALLDIVDGNRTQDAENSAQLVVFGLAERFGKTGRLRPTNAGWNVMGSQGRPFRAEYG